MKVAAVLVLIAVTATQAAAVAEAAADARAPWSSCGIPGITCAKNKREAAAVAEAAADARAPWSSCGIPGITCAKTKRAALAVAEALAEPESHNAKYSLCRLPGIACDKARRSLEQLGSVTESTLNGVLALDKDEEAIQQKNALIGANFPSVSRMSKRDARDAAPWSSCGIPGITCAKAKRSAELVKDDFSQIHKEECFAKGGECHTILKARAAFDAAVKREANPRDAAPWSSCGIPGITCARDVYEYANAKVSGDPAADKADEDCNSATGDCTKAEEYYQQLDSALTTATNAVLSN